MSSKKEVQAKIEVIDLAGNIVEKSNALQIIQDYFKLGKEGRQKHIEFIKKYNYLNDKGCPKGSYVFFDKGNFVYEKLLKYLDKKIGKLNFEKVRLPHFFYMDNAAKELAEKFADRLVSANENKMCYAADPALFSCLQGENLKKVRRIYSPNCFFRKEKDGEYKGLLRSAEFIISDMHSLCSDFISEVKLLHELNISVMNDFCSEWFAVFDVAEEFYDENKEFMMDLVKSSGKCAVIKIMREKSHYYSMQIQYVARFAENLFSQIANLQLDLVNGERFNICINGKPCAIVHASPFGRVEKIIAYLFEQLANGKINSLPFWLAPEQARIIPISEENISYANKLVKMLNSFHVALDARSDVRLGKKILEAEIEKVPIILVIGRKEQASESVSVRNRLSGKIYPVKLSDIKKEIAMVK